MRAMTVRAMTMALLAMLILSMSVVAIDHASTNASAYSPITITVDVAASAEKSAVIPCTVTVTGGPASTADGSGNYSYKAEIIASNTTGSSVSPKTGTSATGKFKFNITMPGEAPQTITLKINATSKDASSGESISKIKEVTIKVVDPIVLTVTVHNTGSVAASNVTAKFYADGTLLNTQIFNLSAGASKTLKQNWSWVNIDNGEHVITVMIDDPSGVVEFSDGNNVYSLTIYVGDQSNPIGGVLAVGVIIMAVLVVLTFLAKPVTRRK